MDSEQKIKVVVCGLTFDTLEHVFFNYMKVATKSELLLKKSELIVAEFYKGNKHFSSAILERFDDCIHIHELAGNFKEDIAKIFEIVKTFSKATGRTKVSAYASRPSVHRICKNLGAYLVNECEYEAVA